MTATHSPRRNDGPAAAAPLSGSGVRVPELVEYLIGIGFVIETASRHHSHDHASGRRPESSQVFWWLLHHAESGMSIAVAAHLHISALASGGPAAGDQERTVFELAAPVLLSQARGATPATARSAGVAGSTSSEPAAGVAAEFAVSGAPYWAQTAGIDTSTEQMARVIIDRIRTHCYQPHWLIGLWQTVTTQGTGSNEGGAL